ncbi:MAG: bifunctional pyr operon transcriptional regulator/uracil phosphoribosyltransferase PyrR [Thiohalomonadaceae bacterium]
MTAHINIEQTLNDMRDRLRELLALRGIEQPCMVGIHTGGLWIARRLHKQLSIDEPLGALNISFYRDDFSRIGMHPQVKPSNLPFDVEGRHIILVDDVLYTGRTIRAALNILFDYGRPTSVILATLVDRGGRELPIQADVVGQHMNLTTAQQVKLSGPTNLALTVHTDGD